MSRVTIGRETNPPALHSPPPYATLPNRRFRVPRFTLISAVLVCSTLLHAQPQTPTPLGRLAGHRTRINYLGFSPDGKLAISASGAAGKLFGRASYVDCTVRLWNIDEAKQVAVFNGHQKEVTLAQISSDSKRLLSAGADNTRLWDVASAKQIREFPGTIARLSPDGRLIATASPAEGPIRIFDVQSGEQIQQCIGHADGTVAIAFSPDSKTLASAGADLTLRTWDIKTGKAQRGFTTVNMPPAVLEFLDDHRFAAANLDGGVQVLDAASGKAISATKIEHGQEMLTEISLAPGTIFGLSPGAAVTGWDLATGKQSAQCDLPNVTAIHFAVSPDGKRLLAATMLTTDVLVFAGPKSK
jgi:WD40 repeat protein